MNKLALSLSVLTLMGVASVSQAQFFAYDSINGNYSWSTPNPGLRVYNPQPAESWLDQSIAFKFTSSGTGKLTTIEVAARYLGAGAGAGTLSFYADSANQVGALLATRSFTPTASNTTGIGSVSTPVDFSSSNITLRGGTRYWVEITPAENQSADLLFNDVNTTQYSSLKRGGSFLPTESWRPAVGMRVQAVPEPASLAAVVIGLGAFVRRRRLRQQA